MAGSPTTALAKGSATVTLFERFTMMLVCRVKAASPHPAAGRASGPPPPSTGNARFSRCEGKRAGAATGSAAATKARPERKVWLRRLAAFQVATSSAVSAATSGASRGVKADVGGAGFPVRTPPIGLGSNIDSLTGFGGGAEVGSSPYIDLDADLEAFCALAASGLANEPKLAAATRAAATSAAFTDHCMTKQKLRFHRQRRTNAVHNLRPENTGNEARIARAEKVL
jgi:hypothetical protein